MNSAIKYAQNILFVGFCEYQASKTLFIAQALIKLKKAIAYTDL
jgi:hypothetical protein